MKNHRYDFYLCCFLRVCVHYYYTIVGAVGEYYVYFIPGTEITLRV